MTEGDRDGEGVDRGSEQGAFARGQGVWETLRTGGEFDSDSTGFVRLPEHGARPRPGSPDPLAAPAPGVPPEEARWPVPEELPAGAPEPEQPPEPPDEPAGGPEAHLEHPLASYVLRVNGADRPVTDAWLGESLLYVLRERLGLAGAKDGCEQGECGACSVQVDGRLLNACLVPAATAAGCEVRTVEGLPTGGEPSDVQRALAESGAVQCGYCIPGLAMAVHDLLEGNHSPTELETRQALSGNLCRCTGYQGVLAAVRELVTSRDVGSPPAASGSEHAVHIPHQGGPAGPGGGAP